MNGVVCSFCKSWPLIQEGPPPPSPGDHCVCSPWRIIIACLCILLHHVVSLQSLSATPELLARGMDIHRWICSAPSSLLIYSLLKPVMRLHYECHSRLIFIKVEKPSLKKGKVTKQLQRSSQGYQLLQRCLEAPKKYLILC